MKLIKKNHYRDGGTIGLETDQGLFCIDKRIGTITKNEIYKGYPEFDNSNLVTDFNLKYQILSLLQNDYK